MSNLNGKIITFNQSIYPLKMKNKKSALRIITAIFLFVAVTSFRLFISPGYQVGDKIKDFKLKNIDGKMYSLANNAKAKGAIIIFTCNHCPFSQAYENRIIALHNMFSAQGYPVVAINSNDKDIVPEDSFEEMVKRAAEYKYPFPYLYDETQDVAVAFGAGRTPHVFVVQKEGAEYIIKYIGAIDDNVDEPAAVTKRYVEDAINALIKGKEVPVKFTKAIGCTIKWKKS